MRKLLLSLLLACIACHGMAAEDLLREDRPDSYTVQDGDTLWDIASMFLEDAWRWPDIWHVNPAIENPHLIFPGDEVYLAEVDGETVLTVRRGDAARTVTLSPVREGDRNERLAPRVRAEPLVSAIPAIPLDDVAAMLTHARIVEQDTLSEAPYVLGGTQDNLVLGPGDNFYARGEWNEDTSVYGIFREGNVYLDPETREVLGFEAMEIGLARALRRSGDVVTFDLSSVRDAVRVGDRLLPTEERRVESTFYPRPPSEYVEGVIMSLQGAIRQVGPNDVVVLNRGEQDGLDVGSVLIVQKSAGLVRDRFRREKVQLPLERVGIVMVFRAFEKMAYALVLDTTQPLRIGDTVTSP